MPAAYLAFFLAVCVASARDVDVAAVQIRTAGTGELEDAKLSLRMTQLERMLKDEVLQNAAKHGGNLMMHDMEDDGVTPYAFWEHVNESTVNNPRSRPLAVLP